jgi:glutamate racemase
VSDRGGAIGIFDSGIGGLSILQALRAELPMEDFIYVADSSHAPYGERDETYVLDRSLRIGQWLVGQNVKAVVVACNTATAAAVDVLRSVYPGLAIIGVEPALKPAVPLSKTKRIGVMATRATLASSRFKQLLCTVSSQAEFILQPCDGLADAIEQLADRLDDDAELIAACARHTRTMGPFGSKSGEIDTLVLGCTHYPLAAEALRSLLGPDVQFIATGEAVARQTGRLLAAKTARSADVGHIQLFSTGQTQLLETAAKRWVEPGANVRLLALA